MGEHFCTMTSSVALRIQAEGNAPKMENQQLVSPSRQCSSTPAGFGQGLRCDNTGTSPILSSGSS